MASVLELVTVAGAALGGVAGSGVELELASGVPGPPGPSYTLPTASGSVLGGIKVGANLSIDGAGVLSASGGGGSATISDSTPIGSLTSAATDALFLLASNSAGNAARKIPLGATGRRLLATTGNIQVGGPDVGYQQIEFWNVESDSYVPFGPADETGFQLASSLTVTGVVSAGNFVGDGQSVTGLSASNLASGVVPFALLPLASAGTRGAVRVGSGLSIDVNGILSASGGGGGMSIGGVITSGTATRVLYEGSGPVLAHDGAFRWLGAAGGGLRIDGSSSDKLLSLGNTSGGRSGYLGYYDAAGQLLFGRSDHSTTAGVLINADSVQYQCSTYAVPFVFVTTSAPVVFTPAAAGGDGPIQFGRRISDSNAACGAEVQCWPRTSQTTAALAIMAPGGGSYRAEWRPSGAIRLASMSDASAENDTVYFSTTGSKLSYKDSGGTVYGLYSGSSLPSLADGAASNSTLFYSTTNGKPSWKDSGGTVTPLF